MRSRWLWCVVLLVAALPVGAQEEKPEPKLSAAQEQYRAILKERNAAQKALVAQYQAASGEEREKIQEQLMTLTLQFSERLFKIAQESPKDAGAEDALVLLSNLAGNEKTEAQGVKAFDLLVTNFPESKKLRQLLGLARFSTAAALEKPIRKVMDSFPDPEVQSQACLMLAENLRLRYEKALQTQDKAGLPLLKQAEEALKVGQTKFGETKTAPEYEASLFALHHLTVGKTAPAIEAEDVVSEKSLKLGDYKGKVVVVCFWGNWCPPCRAMFPHERSLVKRLEGKPFALLGVNSDKDRDKTKEIMAKEQLTWPSFWNGGSTSGPISKLYKVHFWPTIFVLDGQGVIRYRNVRGRAMDVAVDALLKEMETK